MDTLLRVMRLGMPNSKLLIRNLLNYRICKKYILYFRMKPILRRLDEAKIRPAAVNETITKLTEFHKKANSLNQTMPWIPEEKKMKFFGVLVNNTDWIKEKMEL